MGSPLPIFYSFLAELPKIFPQIEEREREKMRPSYPASQSDEPRVDRSAGAVRGGRRNLRRARQTDIGNPERRG